MRTVDNAAIRGRGRAALPQRVRLRGLRVPAQRQGASRRSSGPACALGGRVLDAGCGSGGTALSLAEEVGFAVGLDLDARFRGSGTRLAREKRHRATSPSCRATARACPSATELRPGLQPLRDRARGARPRPTWPSAGACCKPGGVLYLSTAPYLSLAGAHLPRLRVPVPIHLLLGPPARLPRLRAGWRAHAPWTLQERKEANTFIAARRAGAARSRTTCCSA